MVDELTGGEFVVCRRRWYFPSVAARYQANFCENAKFMTSSLAVTVWNTSWCKSTLRTSSAKMSRNGPPRTGPRCLYFD
jgi:hypothetical protein